MESINITSDFDDTEFDKLVMYSHEIDIETLDPAYTLEDIASFLRKWRSSGHDLVIAEVNGVACGYAVGSGNFGNYVVKKVWVHPDYRRIGVGSSLINSLIAIIDTPGQSSVFGKCHTDNIEFFKSLGFSIKPFAEGDFNNIEKVITSRK